MPRVLLLGSTGTIGLATARALIAAGYEVLAFGRSAPDLPGVQAVVGDVTLDWPALPRFDAVVSCLASRTGDPADAWAIDHRAHSRALAAAKAAGVQTFVLLSAICVQKPLLAFQHAKLAFERELAASGLGYSIVRATAYFKSLSGQVERVKAGRPFLVFGDGRLTATKPISDDDLARYLVECLSDAARRDKILPIGGPGPAITPLDQAQALSRLLGREVKIRRAPLAIMHGAVAGLTALAKISPRFKAKAEFARIGRYYATQSMLVWDEANCRYDADATPETGRDTLFDHYAKLLSGQARTDLREHAVFRPAPRGLTISGERVASGRSAPTPRRKPPPRTRK
jgi:divinyl chlorophyllide a 8-vinyl-reductase